MIRGENGLKEVDPQEYQGQNTQSETKMNIENSAEEKLIEETKTLEIKSNLTGQ